MAIKVYSVNNKAGPTSANADAGLVGRVQAVQGALAALFRPATREAKSNTEKALGSRPADPNPHSS